MRTLSPLAAFMGRWGLTRGNEDALINQILRTVRENLSQDMVARIRRTAPIQRGTRMIKLLTGRQLGAHLKGRLINGFCHRAYDLAHLHTAGDPVRVAGLLAAAPLLALD